jgi:hypothetical protein
MKQTHKTQKKNSRNYSALDLNPFSNGSLLPRRQSILRKCMNKKNIARMASREKLNVRTTNEGDGVVGDEDGEDDDEIGAAGAAAAKGDAEDEIDFD